VIATSSNISYGVSLFILTAWLFFPFQGEKAEAKFISTESIPFSRCSCDSSIYCLTDEEYMIVMAQLSAREN
jgi:hypothetical protein